MNRHPPVLSGCRRPVRRGATWVLLALCLAGCKSPDRQHAEEVDWQVPTYGAPRTQPPPRMTSPIAPGPVVDTNLLAAVPPAAATAASGKSLAEAVAAAQGHPPDDGKVYSFTAKDLEITFERFLASLYMTGMLQLGLMHEQGGQPQLDLIGARQTIDTISLLSDKTKGNLSSTEQNFLQNALYELRMAYVEVTNAIAKGPQQAPPGR